MICGVLLTFSLTWFFLHWTSSAWRTWYMLRECKDKRGRIPQRSSHNNQTGIRPDDASGLASGKATNHNKPTNRPQATCFMLRGNEHHASSACGSTTSSCFKRHASTDLLLPLILDSRIHASSEVYGSQMRDDTLHPSIPIYDLW